MKNLDSKLSNLLTTSEKKLELGSQFIGLTAIDIGRFFDRLKMQQVHNIDLSNLDYAMRWNTVLTETGLTDKRPNSKIGVFFERILDRYHESTQQSQLGTSVLEQNPL